MTTDIFIKSYEKDFAWLSRCLHSIQRFAHGFRDVVVLWPQDATPLRLTAERVIPVAETGNPYLGQQKFKCYADRYTDADYILYMDSDTLFVRDSAPQSFMTGGRVNWLHTPRAQVEKHVPWFPVMDAFMGERVEFEFMRRHPILIPRWVLPALRGFYLQRHERTLEDYIMNTPGFSEFNCMGAYCYTHHRDAFHWLNTDDGLPDLHVRQWWSHSPISEAVEEIEEILK